ncbi:carbohydrate ABC transporter permease [Varibaculum prostatecancerukia]|uniref:carbohydrate ABC transporter permease n=1 Tax=Varibaculum prostatecancerukia TaxID=2811781 RepID=UPI001C005A6F|nr:carbohydrate ABC transporter permease [Varibaculum prostatecancerukia]
MKFSTVEKFFAGIILLVLSVLWIFPVVWAFFTSFKSKDEIISSSFSLIPKKFTLANYIELLSANEQTPVLTWFFNSLVISVGETLLVLIVVSLAAYGYTRVNFKGRDVLFLFLLSTMMFPSVLSLIPNYKIVDTLGLLNSPLAVILPGAAGVYNVFLVHQFAKAIPSELDEAARIDGASHLQIYLHVIMPLLKPALTVVALFTFTAAWNDFLWPSIVLTDVGSMAITPGLQLLQGQYETYPGISTAGALIALLPMLAIFIFAQKYFMEALHMTSGIK